MSGNGWARPRREFYDKPPSEGEEGYDARYTPVEEKEYRLQQRVMERVVAVQEMRSLQQQMKACYLREGVNRRHKCRHLTDEYAKRLSWQDGVPPEADEDSVVRARIFHKDWDGQPE